MPCGAFFVSVLLAMIGAMIICALAFTVLIVIGEHLPPSYRMGIPFLIPVVGMFGAALLFAPKRKQ